METVCLKLDGDMLHNIDGSLKKHNYSTRTEFIRDAIRDKLSELTREERIQAFLNLRGKAKKITSNKERKKIKEEASKELMAHLEKKFK